MERNKILPKKGVCAVKIFHSFVDVDINQKSALTVGKFDGLHVGHNFLVKKIMKKKEEGFCTVVVTFDRAPARTIAQSKDKVLMTRKEKLSFLETAGVDILLELIFDDHLMKMSPDQFILNLVKVCRMGYMCCGSDFSFGYKGAGNIEMLKELSEKHGFLLEVVEKIKSSQRDISSTFVRDEIACGNIKKANELLGYPYFIMGDIIHGNHIGSEKIGFPTINIYPQEEKLLPLNGVYITEVMLLGRKYHGVTNVGVRPSIKEKNKKMSIETHILDFDANVYDHVAKVIFLDRIRGEHKFESLQELKTQIGKDLRQARGFFNHFS